MVFMAIVIPIAMQGLSLANHAGVAAVRKTAATQLADRLLNELTLSNQWSSSSLNGAFDEPWTGYRWQLWRDPWTENALRLITVEVFYPVQNQEHSVRISTLVPEVTL